MRKLILLLALITTLFISCSKDDFFNSSLTDNKVLLLKIDYLTNTFEGGKELTFKESTLLLQLLQTIKVLVILEASN